VVLANLTIDCRRHYRFWWGDGDPIHFKVKRRSEVDGVTRTHEPPAGSIRNVTIRNGVAHGVSLYNHRQRPAIAAAVDAMHVRWARN
jgi:hypothetical protein